MKRKPQAASRAVALAQESDEVDWGKDEIIDGEMNAVDVVEYEEDEEN